MDDKLYEQIEREMAANKALDFEWEDADLLVAMCSLRSFENWYESRSEAERKKLGAMVKSWVRDYALRNPRIPQQEQQQMSREGAAVLERETEAPVKPVKKPTTSHDLLFESARNFSILRFKEAEATHPTYDMRPVKGSRDAYVLSPRCNPDVTGKRPEYIVNLKTRSCTCPDTITVRRKNAELEQAGYCGSLECKHPRVCECKIEAGWTPEDAPEEDEAEPVKPAAPAWTTDATGRRSDADLWN